MDLRRLVIHEITKGENQAMKVDVNFSDDLATKDSQAVKFVTELNNRYQNLRQSNGKFKTSAKGLFPDLFESYVKKYEDKDFVDFSKATVCQLQSKILASGPAKGGYIVFADYFESRHFVGIFLIRNRTGNILQKKKSDTKYIINETLHIDFEHLAMACRINKSLYSLGNGGYLTFINRRNVDSNFFTNWICAEELINNIDDTRNLLKILKQVEPPTGEGNNPLKQLDFINDVYAFIKDTPKGAVIDLKQIGSRFYDDENKLTNFAQGGDIILNHEFRPDNGILKQFVNIKARADYIDIAFPQQFINEKKIELFPNDGKIVIKSPSLIEKIKAEMIVSYG
ncbi:MAG: nucleoid-associated protein [Ginsengibacter sp.]